ncbi:type II secretion system protein GspM [Rhabdochromatium marinum]|uniref:type II secretion system protein GspM n=1 Tax=Rhabdochromatium marinum TaxID=48729 RepID=UPI0019053E65|nr:type II secretion system protein GspM [Rhabdochromatium marinum]MBK1647373.1 hypothetical protein [Rhabdochromatium marinum]
MTHRIPKNRRCLLVWGLPAAILLGIVLAVFVPWWQRMADLNLHIDRSGRQIVQYQRIVATLPSLRAELEQVRKRDDTKAFYFAAKTPALAGAELQGQVQDIIRTASARPVSTQILPVDANEKPPRIRVRVQFQGSTQSLRDILFSIEAARPFLFIDQMSLRSAASNVPLSPVNQARAARGNPQRPPRERDELTVRLDIFGYIKGGV